MAENLSGELSGEILVTPEILQKKADEASNAISRTTAAFHEMKNIVSSTLSYWEGDAGDRFRGMFQERAGEVEQMLSRLQVHPDKLLIMAGIYIDEEKRRMEEHAKLPANPIES